MFFKKDQTILEEKPFVFAIDPIQNKKYCGFCFQNANVKECPSCEQFYYCSRKCGHLDLIHKKECKAFRNCSERESIKYMLRIDLLRLFLRLLLVVTEKDVNPTELARFKSLTDEYDNIVKDKERINQLNSISANIGIIMGQEFLRQFSEKDLISYFGRMLMHKIAIKSGEISIGIGIYFNARKFQHSCEANSTMYFSGSRLLIKANRLITQDESPTISLCESSLSDSERRIFLKKSFYFDCNCSKCSGTQAIKAVM
ncbi:unnamed protein product [Brachionus calyciflorus]|uniref:MYND-type domain-containing protein n=1 Tax=Brachionus calyciflorus TaxID=104777 RepID=A0A814LFK9_9BILA|nr:unnamed protein product [Brachionus calyciflorus]